MTSAEHKRTSERRVTPVRLHDLFEGTLAAHVNAWREVLGSDLVSLVLYGSWARGTATVDSDINILVVAERLPRGRWAEAVFSRCRQIV
ncbi:MAG: nucleotidyltransferase domain-containing protein [Firmicutes bacterium]|nr:nucleotidyltransferase domain-containing protein [Bacillota bacterium]